MKRRSAEGRESLPDAHLTGDFYLKHPENLNEKMKQSDPKPSNQETELSKEGVQMTNEYMKKMFNTFNHQENANQNTLRLYLTPVRMDLQEEKQKQHKQMLAKMRQGEGGMDEPLNTAGGM